MERGLKLNNGGYGADLPKGLRDGSVVCVGRQKFKLSNRVGLRLEWRKEWYWKYMDRWGCVYIDRL